LDLESVLRRPLGPLCFLAPLLVHISAEAAIRQGEPASPPVSQKKCFMLRPRNSGANAQPFGFGASKKSRGREIIPSVTAPFALPSQVRNPSPRSRRSARSGAPGGDVPGTPPPADSPKAAPSAGSAPAKSVLPTKNELSLSDALQPSALPPEFSPRGMF
jgi:hypothetical protein